MNLPIKTHQQATVLIKLVYDFVPKHYHSKIEFSFQIFDSKQPIKLEGWRVGFSTFTMDHTNNFESVPETKPNPEPGR